MAEEQRAQESSSPSRRIRVAQALALLALAASLVGALGPAEPVRTTYSWPPQTLPEGTPDRSWFTPLLLARHRADFISATVPCSLPPPLPGAESPTTVLATTRFPARSSGLAVTRSGNRLEFTVGDTPLIDRVSSSSERLDGGDCAYRLRLDGARWSLEGGPDDVSLSARLPLDPTVTGLFSSLDLRSPGAPSIEVTTAVHATRTTPLQALGWAVALLAALGALVVVSLPDQGRRALAPWRAIRRAWANARAPDAAVGAFLLVWWVFAPAAFDDGWVFARELTFSESRGFSTYYSTYGANLPLDYWVEWVHHWLAQATPSLVLNRLPALLCLAAAWMLCRLVAGCALGPSARASLPVWTLAAAFAVGAAAWGMTLRPEPVTALLVTGVAACMVVFLDRKSTAAVACTAALVALALSAHPAGIVSLAPIIAASPQLVRWLRPHAAQATAIAAATLAVLATLLFVGADVEQRRADAQLVRTVSYNDAWRDELFRYSLLQEAPYGAPLRRTSVVLIVLAVLAYVLRRRRVRERLLDFPAWTLVAALVLLVATPSKWPWHFGTLAGLTAIAVCCETARLRREPGSAERWQAWPFLGIGVAALAATWAWLIRPAWNAIDLRTLGWSPGFESWLPVARIAAVLPIVVLAGWLLFRRRAPDRYRIPWRVASWTGLLVAVPVLAFTVGIFVADTAKTSSWTLGRQNLSALAGRDPGCGLAHDLLVPTLSSARPLPITSGERRAAPPAWVPPAPVEALPRFALGPGDGATPWFELPADSRFGLFVAGARGPSDRLQLEWGRHRDAGVVELLGRATVQDDSGPLSGDAPWRFHSAGELHDPVSETTAIRVVLDSGDAPVAVAVTSPVTYESEVLAGRVRSATPTLVLPNLRMYFPCVRQPTLKNGVVEPPSHVVSWAFAKSSSLWGRGSSPFEGVRDLYDLERLSIADSDNPPPDVFVYRLDHRIPGATLVPPTASTS